MKKDGTHRRPLALLRRLCFAAALAGASLIAPIAHADVKWIAAEGDWNVGSNWDSGTVPGATDAVVLSSSAGVTPTAHITTINGNVLNVSVFNGNRLSVETGGSVRTTGTSTLGPDVSIGSNGSSGSFVMSGGNVNVDGQFVVGRGNDASGTFQMSGG